MLALVFLIGCANNYPPLKVVDNVEIDRYLGTWYEIALLPNSFQEGCHCTKAEYSLIDSTTIKVVNSCREDSADGELDKADGKAFVVEGSNNAKLKVLFFWLFKGDYWIIALDQENYNYAMVGNSSREYLWILAREPEMTERTYDMLLENAKEKGFDVCNLQITDQSCFK